eukprot:13546-Heterococcus_DN1.PRE.1
MYMYAVVALLKTRTADMEGFVDASYTHEQHLASLCMNCALLRDHKQGIGFARAALFTSSCVQSADA